MKKHLVIVSLALAGAAMFGFAACKGDEGKNPSDGKEVGTYQGIESVESVYAVGAVTTAKLLSLSMPAAQTSAQAQTVAESDTDYGLPENGTDAEQAQQQAEKFNKYFNMLDSFLDKSATKTVVTENTETEAPLAVYQYKLTVEGKDADGQTVSHTIYYTEKFLSESNDKLNGLHRAEYQLNGLVVMNTAEDAAPTYYYMSGTHSLRTETEGSETETSETIRIRASLEPSDILNYVELLHETEREEEPGENETETLYTYSVYRAGLLVEKTEIEFEQEEEKGGVETEYEVRFVTGISLGTYEIERVEKSGKTWIEVEYLIDGAKGKFVILKNPDGTYRYKYSQNASDDKTLKDYWD